METRERPDRSKYVVRKFNIHDPEANDDDISRDTTIEQRFLMMWTLVEFSGLLMGRSDEIKQRLQSHVV